MMVDQLTATALDTTKTSENGGPTSGQLRKMLKCSHHLEVIDALSERRCISDESILSGAIKLTDPENSQNIFGKSGSPLLLAWPLILHLK